MFLHLLIAILALATVSAASDEVNAPLVDGDEGVCHQLQTVSYIVNENRQVAHTQTKWCWDISQGFRCEVTNIRWVTVPVTKQRQQDVLVCCEGWLRVSHGCRRSVPDEDKEWEEEEGDREEQEGSEEAVTYSPEDEYDEVKEEDVETTESPSTPAPTEPIIEVPQEDNSSTESIPTNEIIKFLTNKTLHPAIESPNNTTPADEATTTVAEISQHNPIVEAMGAEVIGIIVKEIINSTSNKTTTEDAAAKEAATAAAVAAEQAHNNAKVEGMAAEIIGIFTKEIIKSLGSRTVAPTASVTEPAPATNEIIEFLANQTNKPATDHEVPEATTELSTGEQLTAERLSEVERTLLETTKDLSQTYIRSMSRLHRVWSTLRRYSAPRRASFH